MRVFCRPSRSVPQLKPRATSVWGSFTGGPRRLPAEDQGDQALSTDRRQAGILYGCPSGSPQDRRGLDKSDPRPEPDGQPIESSQLEVHVFA